jgi:DNA recombination protein RmuC
MTLTEELNALFNQPYLTMGSNTFSLGQVVLFVLALLGLFFLWMIITSIRAGKRRAANEAAALERARQAEMKMAQLVESQNELTGRMQELGSSLVNRQTELGTAVNQRLDAMGGRIGQSITDTTKNTQESLAKLQERLAVIDKAQDNITGLAGQVVELQNILSNKQTRGAFGEGRMKAIVQDGLPMGSYEFQATLSNSNRPDCLIHMPNDTPSLVIDAKFPLEAWNAIRAAESPERAKIAAQAFKRDVEVHLKAISEKYLITGETQDTAFMFVPSESIFAEIHENFESLIQKAHRSRVVIVSPSLLMLSIQVIQSVLKDTRMREQAHLIQGEVMRLMEDVGRLDDRVRKLDTHFRQAQKDVEMILTSSEKVTKRSTKISDLDFEEGKEVDAAVKPRLKAVE